MKQWEIEKEIIEVVMIPENIMKEIHKDMDTYSYYFLRIHARELKKLARSNKYG